MAFLDNSGDIILDAVLTDTGRKRMAAGNFKISRFALGDDEINYGLYNKNHPSGSAYYDLEILQSPILEAFTHVNASINYGLVSYARNDLLYLPTMLLNTKDIGAGDLNRTPNAAQNVIFLCTRTKKADGTSTSEALKKSLSDSAKNILSAGAPTSDGFVMVENGLQSNDLTATQANQSVFLGQVGLLDSQYLCSVDRKFLTAVRSASGATVTADGTTIGSFAGSTNTFVNDQSMSDYQTTTVAANVSRLYAVSDTATTSAAAKKTMFTGPRGTFAFLGFDTHPDLDVDNELFRKYGTINSVMVDGDGTGQTYDYLDTVVYIKGLSSNTTHNLHLRIVSVSQGT